MKKRSFQKYLEQRLNKNEIEKIKQQAKFEKKKSRRSPVK